MRRLLAFCASGFGSGVAGLLTGQFWFLPPAVAAVVAGAVLEARDLERANAERDARLEWVDASEGDSTTPESVDDSAPLAQVRRLAG